MYSVWNSVLRLILYPVGLLDLYWFLMELIKLNWNELNVNIVQLDGTDICVYL